MPKIIHISNIHYVDINIWFEFFSTFIYFLPIWLKQLYKRFLNQTHLAEQHHWQTINHEIIVSSTSGYQSIHETTVRKAAGFELWLLSLLAGISFAKRSFSQTWNSSLRNNSNYKTGCENICVRKPDRVSLLRGDVPAVCAWLCWKKKEKGRRGR